MKRSSWIRCCLRWSIVAGLLLSLPGWSASATHLVTPEWNRASAAHQKLLEKGKQLPDTIRTELLAQWAIIDEVHDDSVKGLDPMSREYADALATNKALEVRRQALETRLANRKNLSPAETRQLQDEVRNFNADDEAHRRRLDGDLNPRAARYNTELAARYAGFAGDVQRAFENDGAFTGKRIIRLTAKSWIDGGKIGAGQNLQGVMLRVGPNDEPSGPGLGEANDFKLYQTFVAEVEFKQGFVVAARFVDNSLDYRAGKTPWKTLGVTGLIYVREAGISDWKGKKTVTFARSVGGRPDLCFTEPLEVTMKHPFQDIYNTLSVEVSGHDEKVHVGGSDFPSHYFWQGDRPLPPKLQVQPGDYFK